MTNSDQGVSIQAEQGAVLVWKFQAEVEVEQVSTVTKVLLTRLEVEQSMGLTLIEVEQSMEQILIEVELTLPEVGKLAELKLQEKEETPIEVEQLMELTLPGPTWVIEVMSVENPV